MADSPLHEYLVISRGKWKPDAGPDEIQKTIDAFYLWITQQVAAGHMKTGQRLSHEGKTVFKNQVTDGPFGETKEVIGGYWFILAQNLDEASRLMSGNPCLQMGLFFEIRPLELEPASAYRKSNENAA